MIYTILGFLFIALIDLPMILQKKETRLTILYGVLFLALFLYGLCAAHNADLRSPLYLLSEWMKNEWGLTY